MVIGTIQALEADDLTVGMAAEHLVCADLLLAGYRAFLANQCCPYDVAVDVGQRLVRIQVKATRGPRAVPQRVGQFLAYMWHVRRAGKGGRRVYSTDEFDLLALVALDTRKIAYLPPSSQKKTVHIRVNDDPSYRGGRLGKTFAQFPFESAVGEIA